ncbi:hypothetical protein [Pseudomaricurvus sp. HS19]|uniref:hypothetical protein n=1 Tax=Pseudomaricurvus sp. HS19 TaxID=2692626 RepID=UPI001367FF15|nr:hypothetical protein [Pseudomaricurvus sp. HS19]MYM64705.1 hypothetical protein [Pseudomaricurvus sp. HS19]
MAKLRQPWVHVLLGAVACLLAYLPGLSGGFLLDDYATLPFLGQWGGVESFAEFWEYATSGFTGPTGRPIALLTFLLHGADWPADPAPFLVFNLALHLLNGALLFLFLRGLLAALQSAHGEWVAAIAAVLWILHPYQVSTVLYVVQRMVLLSVLFNLAALITYLSARVRLVRDDLQGAVLRFAVAAILAVLAVFSKESAIWIPLQFLIIELTIMSAGRAPLWAAAPGLRVLGLPLGRWVTLFGLAVPLAVFLAYLAWPLLKSLIYYQEHQRWLPTSREFNLIERLLTQQRIVGDYLLGWIVPRVQTAGVFWDGYAKSTSLISPLSTFAWLLVHVAAFVGAWIVRRRFPLLLFAVLWFYGGLLLESTTVMLELKFEHRAYWPGIALTLLMSAAMVHLRVSSQLRVVIASAVVVVLAATLTARASLWGNQDQAFPVWMKENPRSVRALESAMLVVQGTPEADKFMPILMQRAVSHPKATAGTHLQNLMYMCVASPEAILPVDDVALKLSHGARDWRVGNMLELLLDQMLAGHCEMTLASYQKLTSAVRSNRRYRKTRLYMAAGSLSASAEFVFGDKRRGGRYFLRQYYAKVPLSLIMKQSLLLARYGGLPVAVQNLENGISERYEASDYLVMQAMDMLNQMKEDL